MNVDPSHGRLKFVSMYTDNLLNSSAVYNQSSDPCPYKHHFFIEHAYYRTPFCILCDISFDLRVFLSNSKRLTLCSNAL